MVDRSELNCSGWVLLYFGCSHHVIEVNCLQSALDVRHIVERSEPDEHKSSVSVNDPKAQEDKTIVDQESQRKHTRIGSLSLLDLALLSASNALSAPPVCLELFRFSTAWKTFLRLKKQKA